MAISDYSSIFMNFCWQWSASHVKLIFWCKSVMASITTTAKGKLFTWRDIFQSRESTRDYYDRLILKSQTGTQHRKLIFPQTLKTATDCYPSIANVVEVASRTNSNLEPINLKRHHSLRQSTYSTSYASRAALIRKKEKKLRREKVYKLCGNS